MFFSLFLGFLRHVSPVTLVVFSIVIISLSNTFAFALRYLRQFSLAVLVVVVAVVGTE